MIVADSSIVAEGILKDKSIFEHEDSVISLDLALYEVANSIWKHHYLLRDIGKRDGLDYISILCDMIDSGSIMLVHPDSVLMKNSYELAGRHRIAVYDAVFIALALELRLALKSNDEKMNEIFRKETQH